MALPTSPVSSWTRGLNLPTQLFGSTGDNDVELYEDDGEFVLSVEMPGFERDEIDVSWHEGRLNVAAEHEDASRGRKKTYHRSFRMPKEIDEDEIAAAYRNGVLEVTLPTTESATTRGKTIEIEG
ncbi:Hsp20/alpha crystallin family protein [Halostella sp. JP-L12]|uniref:Hsp20/alpha crystallin family protein n=1 Tax=Halostella TaxID=1843185 RepID=UPI000EF77882|nr:MULTISPECIES: Hsp20/alpha crystallin family protein [Halostella]NHN47896.1 Hsp20/alpha crystallin family protein [Halostella sp. JP-L12]